MRTRHLAMIVAVSILLLPSLAQGQTQPGVSPEAWQQIQQPLNGEDPQGTVQTQMFIYRAHNRQVAALAAVAELIFHGSGFVGRSSPVHRWEVPDVRGGPPLVVRSTMGPAIFSSSAAQVGPFRIVPDANGSALLIRAAPGDWPAIKGVLEQLDRRVLIKAVVAEVAADDEPRVESTLVALEPRRGDDHPTTVNQPGLSSSGEGLTLRNVNITDAIEKLASTGQIKVIERTSAMALFGQLVEMHVNDHGTTTSPATRAAESPHASDFHGLISLVSQVDYEGKIVLGVVPQFAVSSETSDGSIVTINPRCINLAMESGQTTMIHGFVHQHTISKIERIPVLADIPLLGGLFNRSKLVARQFEVMVFLTPSLAPRGAD